MRLTTIHSEQICLEMMETAPAERERIYRARLIKPFAFKWACVGIPLTAKEEGGCDVVSAAMNSFYAPTQITDVRRRAEIKCIRSDTFWAACEKSICDTLSGFERCGISLPRQGYVFTVMLSDPQNPMTLLTGDYCGDGEMICRV